MLPQVTDEEYQEFVQSRPFAILVLGAPWDTYTRILKERAAEVGEKFDNLIAVGEVNIDTAPRIVGDLKVGSIPMVAFFRAGKITALFVGASQDISKQAESLIAGEQVKYIHVEDQTIQSPPRKHQWFNWLFSWIYPTLK